MKTTGKLIEALRNLEPFCYQIVHYLLEDERLAVRAARAALLDAGRMAGFAGLASSEQRAAMKKLALRHALAAKSSALAASSVRAK